MSADAAAPPTEFTVPPPTVWEAGPIEDMYLDARWYRTNDGLVVNDAGRWNARWRRWVVRHPGNWFQRVRAATADRAIARARRAWWRSLVPCRAPDPADANTILLRETMP